MNDTQILIAVCIAAIANMLAIAFHLHKEKKEDKRHRENLNAAMAKLDRDERQRLKAYEATS